MSFGEGRDLLFGSARKVSHHDGFAQVGSASVPGSVVTAPLGASIDHTQPSPRADNRVCQQKGPVSHVFLRAIQLKGQ